MNVLMISPDFPWEMPLFTRGLARVGARVFGLGEQPRAALSPNVTEALDGYLRVDSIWDEQAVIAAVRRFDSEVSLDLIECLWEPAMILAARLREALDLPGMRVDEILPFRDKENMKQRLDRAGIRTPRHVRCAGEREIREGAERIGFPLIVKPIAGAGSADTHRVNSASDLDRVLPLVRHVPEMSVEEFISGEEFTFDTIAVDGEVAFYNVAWYRPCPLIGRTVEWISPQTVTLRDPNEKNAAVGVKMGFDVLKALGFRTGFSHMEWFLKSDGEAVFGEIGARPPGARSVELMNYASDVDTFTGWAEATCHGKFTQNVQRRYNCAIVFKRAEGSGRIQRIVGLERLVSKYRQHVVCIDLLPVGARRRNWKQTLISDGYVIVRHPDLDATLEIADRFGTELQLFAE